MKFSITKYTLLLVLGFTINSTIVKAIVPTDSLITPRYYKGSKNRILVAPFSVLDMYSPAIQFGFERKVSSRIGIQITAAYIVKRDWIAMMNDLFDTEDERVVNHQGFKLRVESKYHLKHKFYTAIEIFYVKNYSTNAVINQSRTNLAEDQHIDYFDLGKKKIGISTKFGKEMYLSKKWFIDFHVGLGIVRRKVNHFYREFQNKSYKMPAIDYLTKDGVAYIPHLPVNVKIGYCL